MRIQMRTQKTRIIYTIILIIISGCGFTSGSYQDILEAQEHINEREYGKAVELYKKILLQSPSKNIEIKINYQLAEINSLYLSEYKEANKYYKKVTSITDEPLWQTKALEKMGSISFENLKDFKTAQFAYKKLKNFRPKLEKQSFYKLRYALTYFHQENYKQASKLLRAYITEEDIQNSLSAYYHLGLINFYKKKWEVAVSYWFDYLKREKNKDKIIQVKFMIANAYESNKKLKEAYNIYYSIIGSYPNPDVIKSRLNSLYKRRVARKR
jgi:tetratricopeptide (TPR) repeat protein